MRNTLSDEITCALVEKTDDYHFAMLCEDCDALTLSRITLRQAEQRYREGLITQVEFEAYMYVWATFSPHGAKPEWTVTPFDSDVLRVAKKIASLLGKELA